MGHLLPRLTSGTKHVVIITLISFVERDSTHQSNIAKCFVDKHNGGKKQEGVSFCRSEIQTVLGNRGKEEEKQAQKRMFKNKQEMQAKLESRVKQVISLESLRCRKFSPAMNSVVLYLAPIQRQVLVD